MLYILSISGIITNTNKIKKLHKKLKNIENTEEIEKIKNEIVKTEKRVQVLLERREKTNKNPYKIKINGNDNIKLLIVIMIVCTLTGLLTPLGTTPYTYLVKTMQGNTTHNISEHLPLVLINNINFMIVIIMFIAILMFTDTRIRLSDLFMLGGLMLLTFYSRRQESMFVLMCAFVLNRLLCAMFDKYDPEGCKKIQKWITTVAGMIITICLVLIISVQEYKPKIGNDFVSESAYPVMASDWILDNLDVENIRLYNEYNYGSYLLFKDIPVFIDSRADLYSPEFNEGVDVFTDFLNLSGVDIDNVEEVLDKYEITHLIMYKNAKLRTFIKQDEEKYEQMYEDDYFCIYERKQV